MKAAWVAGALVVVLAGCSGGVRLPGFLTPDLPGSGKGEAQQADRIDTATEEQLAEARGAPARPGESLGQVVGSLGSVAEAGFWLKTPLVTQERPGRVVVVRTGKGVNVTLRPDSGGGHRLSLSAMRALEEPLAGLPDIEVFAQ